MVRRKAANSGQSFFCHELQGPTVGTRETNYKKKGSAMIVEPLSIRILYFPHAFLVESHLTMTVTETTSLVTGASGLIASRVVQQLLKKGDRVHATVRSTKNKKKIQHLLDTQERWPGKLNLYEADLLVAGPFEAPMQGWSVVYHIASPFFIENKIRDGQKEVIEPALKGTQCVLDAVQKCETVKLDVLGSYGSGSESGKYR